MEKKVKKRKDRYGEYRKEEINKGPGYFLST